jgi:hypothetical protein
MGIEMLLNALMKMCGFSKEQLQALVDQGMDILNFTRDTAISVDERVKTIENQQALILSKLEEIKNSSLVREIPEIEKE